MPKPKPVEFNPANVAAITGVTETMQRQWRMNGMLPPNEAGENGSKHARFGLADVVKMFVLRRMQENRSTLAELYPAASAAVVPIMDRIAAQKDRQIGTPPVWVGEIDGKVFTAKTIEEVDDIMKTCGTNQCKLLHLETVADELMEKLQSALNQY